MNRTLLFISLFSILTLVSCHSSKKNEAGKQNEIELVAEKQLAFPLDEQTYYLSKSMFQFEENGKEYLHFENTQKSLYDIVIFDIENKHPESPRAKRRTYDKTSPSRPVTMLYESHKPSPIFINMFFPGVLKRNIIAPEIHRTTLYAVPPIDNNSEEENKAETAVETSRIIHPIVAIAYLKPNWIV